MKTTLIALAILASFATPAFAHDSTATVTGSNVLVSGSSSGASAGGTGSAYSSSSNQGQAISSASIGASYVSSTGPTQTLNAGKTELTTVSGKAGGLDISGFVVTRDISIADSSQSGGGVANAGAGGVATANVGGSGSFQTVNDGPRGSVGGNAASTTTTGAYSANNAGRVISNAGRTSEFGSNASADITTTNVQSGSMKPDTFFGYPIPGTSHFVANGTTESVDVKNAATGGYANTFSNGGFTTNTGTASAPMNTPIANVGAGSLTNQGSAASNASSSVSGKVSTSLNGSL